VSVGGCPTGKKRYASKYAAKVALRRQQGHEGSDNPSRKAYRCPDCGGWHLTTRPELRRDAPPVRPLGDAGSALAEAYNTLRLSVSHADALDQLVVSFSLDRGTLRRTLQRAGVLDERVREAPSPVSRRAYLEDRGERERPPTKT
jgi:hypothetical protein